MKYLQYAAFICLTEVVRLTPVNNSVLKSPEILCLPEAMMITIETERAFRGHFYVKGQFKNPNCHAEFHRTDNITKISYLVSYQDCAIMRVRAFAGDGVMFAGSLIVQFHPLFVTKADRGFTFTCAYTDASKTLTQEFDVSMLPSTALQGSLLMPECQYTIHRGEVAGPNVRFAVVGEEVYHKWSCTGALHGILVHSCSAIDESGEESPLTDSEGCTLDPVAMGSLVYTDNLTVAYAEVHVFKFADQSHVKIRCQITVCQKAGDGCKGVTPPTCSPHATNEGVMKSTDDQQTVKTNPVTSPVPPLHPSESSPPPIHPETTEMTFGSKINQLTSPKYPINMPRSTQTPELQPSNFHTIAGVYGQLDAETEIITKAEQSTEVPLGYYRASTERLLAEVPPKLQQKTEAASKIMNRKTIGQGGPYPAGYAALPRFGSSPGVTPNIANLLPYQHKDGFPHRSKINMPYYRALNDQPTDREERNVDLQTMDITSPEVLVLSPTEPEPFEVCDAYTRYGVRRGQHVVKKTSGCLSTLMFIYIICTLGALFSATLIISMWCVRRYYKQYYCEKARSRTLTTR